MSEKMKRKRRRLGEQPGKQLQTAARARYLSSLAAGHAAKKEQQQQKGL